MKLIVLDTETTNSLDDPFMYDIGWSVCDTDGKVFLSRSFVVEEIFMDLELMASAYFAEKRSQYWDDIINGSRTMAKLYEIRSQLRADCEAFDISIISAHNASFDYRAMQYTQRFLTCSRYRWFVPYGVEMWDSLKMARKIFGKDADYKRFCIENGYMTSQNSVRLTAEILYRYISGKHDFVEAHTGLEDVQIEKEIFAECWRRGCTDGRLWDYAHEV